LIFNVAIFSELSSGCYNTIAQNGDYCSGIRMGDQLELQPGAGPQLNQEQPGARGTVQGGGANIWFPIDCNRSIQELDRCFKPENVQFAALRILRNSFRLIMLYKPTRQVG